MSTEVKKSNHNLKQEILKLKAEKKAVILAHNYQLPEIQGLADYLGDSLELARISRDMDAAQIWVPTGQLMPALISLIRSWR